MQPVTINIFQRSKKGEAIMKLQVVEGEVRC
jgi:hypothetical protein